MLRGPCLSARVVLAGRAPSAFPLSALPPLPHSLPSSHATMARMQAEYQALCDDVRAEYDEVLAEVREHNAEIWPMVQVARRALAELGRVQAFAEHIKYCANKFYIGVNLLPNTPNYDRVVEMQALTEALARAYPDMGANDYPWPNHERKREWRGAELRARASLSAKHARGGVLSCLHE